MLSASASLTGAVFEIQEADGELRSVDLRVNAILDRHGEIAGARCAMLDITDRLRAEEHARLLNLELEARVAERTAELLRSNAELQQFAYIISHDLQSPLRQLKSVLTSSAQDRVEDGLAIAERMSTLVSRLLDYSVLTQSPVRPAKSVDVGGVVQESIANLHAVITDSRATIELGDLPAVVADPTVLVQVFQNLIGNALKYARSEVLRIRCQLPKNPRSGCFQSRTTGLVSPLFITKRSSGPFSAYMDPNIRERASAWQSARRWWSELGAESGSSRNSGAVRGSGFLYQSERLHVGCPLRHASMAKASFQIMLTMHSFVVNSSSLQRQRDT